MGWIGWISGSVEVMAETENSGYISGGRGEWGSGGNKGGDKESKVYISCGSDGKVKFNIYCK